MIALGLPGAAPSLYDSARRKVDVIENDRAPAGAVYSFSKAEIEAWATREIPEYVPEGFRDPRVEIETGTATGRAFIDFMRLRHGKGAPKNWFLDKLLEGERPVSVTVEIRSANGSCTVYLRRLEISGVAATGSVLDFLVKNFFLTLFPNAKINEPFRLEHRMDSIDLRPNTAVIRISRRPPPKRAPGPSVRTAYLPGAARVARAGLGQ